MYARSFHTIAKIIGIRMSSSFQLKSTPKLIMEYPWREIQILPLPILTIAVRLLAGHRWVSNPRPQPP